MVVKQLDRTVGRLDVDVTLRVRNIGQQLVCGRSRHDDISLQAATKLQRQCSFVEPAFAALIVYVKDPAQTGSSQRISNDTDALPGGTRNCLRTSR